MTGDLPHRQVPVAVVGVGALLPGATDVDGFWRNVLAGRDLMTDVPSSRWLIDDYYDPTPAAADKTYGRRGAFLPEVDFDPVRYAIPPNTLSSIDTSQLLALMVADQVLTDCAAGLPADRDRISVLLGASPLQLMVEMSARLQRPMWLRALRESGVAEPAAQAICDRIAGQYVPWREETFPGLLSNVISGRIANRFDLRGANHTTDAACASSFAALYAAIAELSLFRSDLVITGGVDTMNDITMYTCFSQTPAMSRTGDCRPFSAAADGTMLGEGLAMVALKRLADAEREGDHVYAVIRGVGASSDGRGTAIYAPLAEGQMRALRRAYAVAGYGPETVGLVEAHGTGTNAGDAAEVAALRAVFEESGRADRQWCALGSVKSQVGHTKSAAGAVGLLKAVLSVHHGVLPPTIKVDQPNPALGLDDSPFFLNTTARPWVSPGDHPRRASVSSFGFGGTNFHVTLEEYVPPRSNGGAGSAARPARRTQAGPTELVLFGAESPEALLAELKEIDPGPSFAAFARATRLGFDHRLAARLAIVARDAEDLAEKLTAAAAAWIEGGTAPPPAVMTHYATGPAAAGGVGFLFPGQGAQYVGMGADLATHMPGARTVWDRAAGIDLGADRLDGVVFPPQAFTDAGRAEQEARLTATEWAQPALAAHSMALLEVLGTLGLRPDAVAGHSLGELVALHAAAVVDEETLIRLARRRGELMRDASATPGGMLAVTAGRARVEAAIAGRTDLWLANHNAPSQAVLAGGKAALEDVAAQFIAEGIGVARLNTATGFHSPLVAAAEEPLLEQLRRTEVKEPAVEVFAGSDGRPYPSEPDQVRRRLAAQLTAPVEFVDVIEAMYARGIRTFVEVGAGAVLTGLAGQILGAREHIAVNLDRRGRNGLTTLQDGLGRLAVAGLALNFGALSDVGSPSGADGARERPRAAVKIDGGNYGRPYPPPASAPPVAAPQPVAAAPDLGPPASPARVLPPPADPPPALPPPALPPPALPPPAGAVASPAPALDGAWLRVVEDAQRQAAEAHAAFQHAMTESHVAYLQLAETALAGMLGAAGAGTALPAPPQPVQPQVPRRELPQPGPPPGPAPAWAPLTAPSPAAPTAPSPAAPAAPTTPSPAALPPAAELAAPDEESMGSALLSLVAERTGFPEELLNLDMELDTDLGIDSIKKVEILSAFRERVGAVSGGDTSALGGLRSLRSIVESVGHGAAAKAEPAPTTGAAPVARWKVRAVARPRSGSAMPGLADALLTVTDDGTGVAPLVAAALTDRGIRAEVAAEVPADAAGVIVLDGLRPAASIDEALEAGRAAFRAARRVAGRMRTEGGVFVTVQDTGGDFGLAGPEVPVQAWSGGPAALVRTVAKEWPRASVKAIDCQVAGRPAAEVATAIVAELLHGGGSDLAGLRADGARLTPELVEAGPGDPAGGRIGPRSVIVATGGARGVTAAALRLLAGKHRPRLVLLGRTPLSAEPDGLSGARDEGALVRLLAQRRPGSPAELTRRARGILAVREVRETLDALGRDATDIRYLTLDVRDPGAVADALAGVRRDWGPITGIVHGAGVLADARVEDKTDSAFAEVFDTKVEGLRTLLAATADDPIDLLCAFSSVAAVFGNPGQSDYAMANEVLNHVLSAESARRPGCLVRAIAWGPWQGGMVTAEQAGRFGRTGVPLIDLDAGARAFLAEVDGQPGDVRVVLSAGGPDPSTEFSAQVTVVAPGHAHLADHAIDGIPVVPVATVLDWFTGAAASWQPGAAGPIVLRDLRVLDKISLPLLSGAGHRLTLHGHLAPGGSVSLGLIAEDGRPHYRATAAVDSSVVPAKWEIPGSPERVSDPYEDRATLFHGPRFRAVRGAPGLSPAGADGMVASAASLGWDGIAGQVDPAAIDGGLQLAVLWARRAGAGRTLPMAIGECRVYRPGLAGPEVRCLVRAGQVDDAGARCDVALVDPDLTPRVELLGVRLVRRPE